jgi:hypothetical protein
MHATPARTLAHGLAIAVCLLGAFSAPAPAQEMPTVQAQDLMRIQKALERQNCPGDPAGNLASFDCNFTARMRIVEFVSTSVTDQAAGGAAFFGGFAYLLHRDPAAWGRGWNSVGRSFASRYTQNFAKGGATYLVGTAMRSDPRNVSLANDPCVERTTPDNQCSPRMTPATVRARIGHALLDWATVRRSARDAKGRRWPNLPLWTGAAASGLVGNAWLPNSEATPASAAITAASSLATALGASFYTEFSPEIGRLLGGLFKRGRVPPPGPTATGRKP